MAVNEYLFKVTIPYISGLSTDVSVNDFVFQGDAAVNDVGDVVDGILSFYNTENSATGHQRPVSGYIGEIASRVTGACRIDQYEAGVAGAPINTWTWTLGAAPDSTGPLPTEVAACLSYHADYTGLTSAERARRRGRIYLGPLDRISGEMAVSSFRPSQQFINDCVNAADEFLHDFITAQGFDWQVWSRAGNLFHDVTAIGMDDAYDTLRSRGPDPTHVTWV